MIPRNPFEWMIFGSTFLMQAHLQALGDLWMVYEFTNMRQDVR